MTPSDHATKVHITLKEVETTARAHNRAIVAHHAALSAFATECGADAGLDSGIITAAAAPKNEPPDQN